MLAINTVSNTHTKKQQQNKQQQLQQTLLQQQTLIVSRAVSAGAPILKMVVLFFY